MPVAEGGAQKGCRFHSTSLVKHFGILNGNWPQIMVPNTLINDTGYSGLPVAWGLIL